MEKKFPFRFFVVTFLWSWSILLPMVLLNGLGIIQTENISNMFIILLVAFIGALGPAAGAFFSLLTTEGKGAIKPFIKLFLSLKFGWKAWLSIFLILGLSTMIAWITPELFGEDRIPTYLPSVFIFPVYLLLMVFFGGGQEEIGWRGYILPFLEKRFGLIIGSLILGIVWAIWHLPLWFIPGTSQTYMNFFVFMLSTIGYSFIFSWIIKISGNRLLSGLLVHGTANAFVPLFPTVILEHNVSQIRFWIYALLILAVGIIIVTIRTIKNRKNGT
jgi:membrane protease YdiL (CAAX protease family)